MQKNLFMETTSYLFHEIIARVHALELFILFGCRLNKLFFYLFTYLFSIYSLFIYVLILILLYWFYSISVYFYFPTVYYFIQLWIRINIITKMMAIIKVSCSYCSVVSYAYEINKVLYHPLACCRVFLCTLHTGFNLTFFPFTPLSISHFQSSAGLFSPTRPAAPCPAPSLSLSLSLYSEAVTLGVRCLGWPHLQLYLPLCVSRSLSGLYNRSRIRTIIAPWLLTAGVYCGFVWEGRTTAHGHTYILTANMPKYLDQSLEMTWFNKI